MLGALAMLALRGFTVPSWAPGAAKAAQDPGGAENIRWVA